MKILFISAANSIHTVKWVNSLAERGHEVYLAFNRDHNPTQDHVSAKVKLHSMRFTGSKAYYLNACDLRKIYAQIKPDVVNAHFASGYGTLARIAGVRPLILSVWGSDVYDFPNQSSLKMNLIKKNLMYADKIASTSYCMAEVTKKLVIPSKIDITVTPFGVDVERFSKKKFDDTREQIIIGNIKLLSSKYGIDDLIKAIKILKDDFVKANEINLCARIKVKIYGDGNQKDELIQLVSDLNLNDSIEFMGKIPNDEVPRALEQFDIFCATSILDSESFGVAVVEAMSMSLPIVATDVDGFKEVVEDGVTGYIVKRKKPEDIAHALKELVLSKQLRLGLGQNGRERVLKLYDWEKNVDTMVELYKNCIGK